MSVFGWLKYKQQMNKSSTHLIKILPWKALHVTRRWRLFLDNTIFSARPPVNTLHVFIPCVFGLPFVLSRRSVNGFGRRLVDLPSLFGLTNV